jgi:predicted nucleic acid-binding protein
MHVYLDSSALIKRVVIEPESDELVEELDRQYHSGAVLTSSTLAWIEVARALRSRLGSSYAKVGPEVDAAMSGVVGHPMGGEVVSLSRRLDPDLLRSLDAIHLATALLRDADLLITYDERLAAAARHHGLPVAAPGCAAG